MVAHACNPSTLGGGGRWIIRSGVWGQPGQHTETPSLQKIQKISWSWVAGACNPSYSGGWGRRIAWTREAEVVVSWDCATALQPGWHSETLSQKKKKRIQNIQNRQVYKDSKHLRPSIWGWRLLGRRVMKGMLRIMGFIFGLMKVFRLGLWSCCTLYEYTKNRWIVNFGWLILWHVNYTPIKLLKKLLRKFTKNYLKFESTTI